MICQENFSEGKKGFEISAITVIRPMAEVYAKLYSMLEDRADIEIESRAVERATAWLSDLEHRYGIDPGAVNLVVWDASCRDSPDG